MEYDKEKYKIINWKNPLILHWAINPGLIFNELVLGQTIPKTMLVERGNPKVSLQKAIIPCPHCGTLHPSTQYSKKLAFKNWFGLYCTECKGIIPVQRNLFSLLILTITFPIWGWFKKSWKAKWLSQQPKRYNVKDIPEYTLEAEKQINQWIKHGIVFGAIMFLFTSILLPLLLKEDIIPQNLFFMALIWLLAGLAWGFIMKKWMLRMNKKIQTESRY